MRIATGGVQHETNTFSNVPTTLADFERDSACGSDFAGGQTIEQLYRGTGTIHGGYLAAASDCDDVELLPLLCVRAQPSGVVEQQTFDTLLGLFLDRLKESLPVDGVVLDLHGAMVTEAHEDAEGAFIQQVREVIGSDVPLFVTLDLHANITRQIADVADVVIGFDTYPHVDMYERGREAVELMIRTLRKEVAPVQAYRQLPLLTMPPMQCTLREPMQSFMEDVRRMEAEAGVLTATVSMGFPFADIHDAGVSVLVTTDDDENLANRKADELSLKLWNLRDNLQPQLTTIEAAMDYATHQGDGLVVFADGSDNPGGGAPCDGTVALQAMIDAGFQDGVVGVLADPETVELAHRTGVGHEFDAVIGGKTDSLHGSPVKTRAYVKTLGDGRFIHQGPMRQGLPGDLGRMAVLVVAGIEIVVSTHRMQLLDAEMLRVVGIAPERRRLLVVKSAVHFRAHIGPLADTIFDGDTPGIHRPDFGKIDYKNLRGGVYPIQRDVSFP